MATTSSASRHPGQAAPSTRTVAAQSPKQTRRCCGVSAPSGTSVSGSSTNRAPSSRVQIRGHPIERQVQSPRRLRRVPLAYSTWASLARGMHGCSGPEHRSAPLLREADARQGVGRGVWLQRVFPTGCRRRDVLRRSLQPGTDIGVAVSRRQVETIWEMNISGGRHALRRLFCRWLPIHRQWLSITLPTPSSVVANKGGTDRRRLEACWSAVLGVPQHRTPRRPALPRPLDQAA